MDINRNEVPAGVRVFSIITSILMIGIGFYLFFNLRYIVWLFSAAVLLQGVALIVRYFVSKGERNGWDILSGIINILFGGIMLFGGTATRVAGVLTMEMFISIWTLFAGFSHIFGSFGLKKMGVKKWYWSLTGGILLVIFSVILLTMPLMGTLLLVEMAGIYASIAFIIAGFTGLAAGLSSSGS